MLRRMMKETIWILLTATVLAAGAHVLRHDQSHPITPPASTRPEADIHYQSIGIEEAERLFKQGKALFADARPSEAFAQGHIAGAVHLDPQEMDVWSEHVMAEYPQQQTIITYCQGTRCDLSRQLAEKLTWLGFEHVYYLIDGWGQWKKRGLPAE
jgi:rhodanese-related sulfurtransferase